MQILAAIIALLKAIPGIVHLIDMFNERNREKHAQERKNAKDSAVDAGLNAALGVRDTGNETQQQPKADGETGLPKGGTGGS